MSWLHALNRAVSGIKKGRKGPCAHRLDANGPSAIGGGAPSYNHKQVSNKIAHLDAA